MTANGETSQVTVSKTLEAVKNNYITKKKKDAITGEALGDEEDKFPGAITYEPPASGISKNIVVTVDNNLNVSGYVEKSTGGDDDDTPKYDVFESEYTKTGDYYYYEPDLSGFNPENTYYVVYGENGNSESVYGRIDRVEKPTSGWHDYGNKLWANVVTVNESNVTYWTWIPRYKYILGDQIANIHFIDLNDNCKMNVEGKEQIVDVSKESLPESFLFGNKKLKGYWTTKYEIQLSESSGLEQLSSKINGSSIEVTTTKPSGLYTIYLDGKKYKEHQSLDSVFEIKNLKSTKVYDVCVYSETNNRMVGRRKRMVNSNISVDTSGFDKASTYYVAYDGNGKEYIAGRMDKTSTPAGWYNYEDKIWANVVTVNESNVTYWTYIPRYEYDTAGVEGVAQMANVRFIPVTQTTADTGFQIPESFKFGGKDLAGYWVSKYEIQLSESSGIEQLQVTAGPKNINVTTSNPSGKYTIYVNGEVSKTGVTLPYTIKDLNWDSAYDICVYSEDNKRMVGAKKKSADAIEAIKVDLSGFNPDCTYYVTYDENGNNEKIGDKIQLDDKGNATNMPKNWYNYKAKIWANIVTKGRDANGNELITYWTYIPRYEYDTSGVEGVNQMANARFIPLSQKTPDTGFQIPECFSFGGKDLAGYWVSKYEIQGTID